MFRAFFLFLFRVCLISAVLINGNVYAQNADSVFLQAASSASIEGTAGNFVISSTIGEMVLVSTWQQSGLLVTQGVIQPYSSAAESGYSGFYSSELKVFPSPTSGVVQVAISIFNSGKIGAELYDISGKLLQQDAFDYTGFTTKQYSLAGYANSLYYLKISFTPADPNITGKKATYRIAKIK